MGFDRVTYFCLVEWHPSDIKEDLLDGYKSEAMEALSKPSGSH